MSSNNTNTRPTRAAAPPSNPEGPPAKQTKTNAQHMAAHHAKAKARIQTSVKNLRMLWVVEEKSGSDLHLKTDPKIADPDWAKAVDPAGKRLSFLHIGNNFHATMQESSLYQYDHQKRAAWLRHNKLCITRRDIGTYWANCVTCRMSLLSSSQWNLGNV